MIIFFSRLALSASSFAGVILSGWMIDLVFHTDLPWFVRIPISGILVVSWFIGFVFMVAFWFVEPRRKK